MTSTAKLDQRGAADMRPCDRCGRTDPRRMIALMAHWFAGPAGVSRRGGYFYLCPDCYLAAVGPHLAAILNRLAQDHPSTRKLE